MAQRKDRKKAKASSEAREHFKHRSNTHDFYAWFFITTAALLFVLAIMTIYEM